VQPGFKVFRVTRVIADFKESKVAQDMMEKLGHQVVLVVMGIRGFRDIRGSRA
jgi:hypothetical protein